MYFYQFSTIYGQIIGSHSIKMLSIESYTKSLQLVTRHHFNNAKLSNFASYMEQSFTMYVRFIDVLRLLDAL